MISGDLTWKNQLPTAKRMRRSSLSSSLALVSDGDAAYMLHDGLTSSQEPLDLHSHRGSAKYVHRLCNAKGSLIRLTRRISRASCSRRTVPRMANATGIWGFTGARQS